MASAYASPPRSPTLPQPGASAPGQMSAESLFAALSQPPPPTLREVLSAYASQGQGDREMLIALLKAKAAEDQRITSIAKLQQQVVQMQMTVISAQIQQNLTQSTAASSRSGTEETRKGHEDRRSPVSPSPPKRHASTSPTRVRAHPYSRPSSRAGDGSLWTSRRSWDARVSDERSTSDDGAEY